jgi:ABC-type antimicrobial peptide transport system permease subunit
LEIGIRIALGATRADVTSMVLFQGLRLSALGIASGLAVAVALARTLKTFLYGIAPTDSMSFVIAGVLLLGVSTFASLVPARRATRIDPIHALRSE